MILYNKLINVFSRRWQNGNKNNSGKLLKGKLNKWMVTVSSEVFIMALRRNFVLHHLNSLHNPISLRNRRFCSHRSRKISTYLPNRSLRHSGRCHFPPHLQIQQKKAAKKLNDCIIIIFTFIFLKALLIYNQNVVNWVISLVKYQLL